MLIVADIALHIIHITVIAGNVLGWMWPRARMACLVIQSVTLACWVGFGLAQGWWGYCPLSSWHWDIKLALGEENLPANYLTYIFSNWFHLHLSDDFLSGLILGLFSMAVAANLFLILSARRKRIAIPEQHSGASLQK